MFLYLPEQKRSALCARFPNYVLLRPNLLNSVSDNPPYQPYLKFREEYLREILHRLLYVSDKHLCKFSRRYSSRNLRYALKRAVLKHAWIGTIGVDNCWRLPYKTHIHWKGKGLSFHYYTNCGYYMKIEFTTTLRRNVVFNQSRGNTQKLQSQNLFIRNRACVSTVSKCNTNWSISNDKICKIYHY